MNRALPLHPHPASRETLFSFLSRFAAMNAATATDFAFDLGFGIKRFIRFEGEALDRLVEAAAIDAQSLEKLISWTGRPVGDAWTEFRGERYPSKAVRNPVMRGCPMCLREDASANPQNPSNVMVMRGDWLLRDVTICCRHHHPIVPLWQCSSAAERFDIGVHLHDLAPAIIVGDLDQPLRQPSPYDLWLDERLENGKDATWLRTIASSWQRRCASSWVPV